MRENINNLVSCLHNARRWSVLITNAVTATANLQVEDLDKIHNFLWPVRHKWYQIGITLKIHASTLQVIRDDHPHRTDDCYRAMLEEWLNNGNPAPSWKELIEALRSPPVGATVIVEGRNTGILIICDDI